MVNKLFYWVTGLLWITFESWVALSYGLIAIKKWVTHFLWLSYYPRIAMTTDGFKNYLSLANLGIR